MVELPLELVRLLVELLVEKYDTYILFTASWAVSVLGWIIAWGFIVPAFIRTAEFSFPGEKEERNESVFFPEYLVSAFFLWLCLQATLHRWDPWIDADQAGQILVLAVALCAPAFTGVMVREFRGVKMIAEVLTNFSLTPFAIVALSVASIVWVVTTAPGLQWQWWLVPYLCVLGVLGSLVVALAMNFWTPSDCPWYMYVAGVVGVLIVIGPYFHLWQLSWILAIIMIIISVLLGIMIYLVLSRDD